MVAWNNAVIINTAAGYRAFLAQYPDSDLTATARKMEERVRNRPNVAAVVAVPIATPPLATNASLAAPTCPCNTPSPSPQKKVDAPSRKRVDPAPPPKRVERQPPRRVREVEEDVVIVRRPPPRDYYEPAPGPSIGIGIGIGGGYGGGGYGRGGHQGPSRSGY
jgi:hypothetical protein